ncbi:hypothetical protein [Butyrivibrio sp. WCE2006]|uniref:hypothetical protein n=1 Tax=Butyrivibrio sp. WCE2006 TaxID=1410611 RepID=UPI0005D19F29|nr:hypothetical protein [Butyrivibrio sp. WCE2006]
MDFTVDISQNGAQTLTTTSKELEKAASEIDRSLQQLVKIAQTCGGDLGIYAGEVDSFIVDQQIQVNKCRDSVTILAQKMNSLASWILLKVSEYQKEEAVGVIASANEALRIDAQRSDFVTKKSGFGNISFAQQESGFVFTKGANYEKFIKGYYDYEHTTYQAYETVVTETISASMIEGLRFSPDEVNNPDVFWGDNTKDFYMEIASRIPEVRDALAQGRELSDLIDDPELGTCASLYFDPRNIPKVDKWDDYYCFNGHGRHRIIAAMELGFDISVRIAGERHYIEQ